MNAKHCPPGTLLLASSRCPFCGSPMEVYDSSCQAIGEKKGSLWTGGCSSLRIGVVCEIRPTVTKRTRLGAISAICRRVA